MVRPGIFVFLLALLFPACWAQIHVERVIPRVPYVSEAGLQTVLDFIKKRNPHVANAKVQDFIDNRFVKELEDTGFIRSLYAW